MRGCGQAIRAVARLHLQEFDEGRRRTRSRECKPAPRKLVAHSVFRAVWTLTSGLPRRNRIKTDQVPFLELALVGGMRKEPFAIHGIVGELVRTCANSLSQELFGIFAPSEVLSDKSCISCRAIGSPCRASHQDSGWGGRIRTYGTRYQKPLPYLLATPQQQRTSRNECLERLQLRIRLECRSHFDSLIVGSYLWFLLYQLVEVEENMAQILCA